MTIATVVTLRCDVPACRSRWGLSAGATTEDLTRELLAAVDRGWVVARLGVRAPGTPRADWCPRHRQASRRPRPPV